MRGISLPIPGAPNVAQVSQAPQEDTKLTDDYEYAAKPIAVIGTTPGPAVYPPEYPVFQTTRRWRGVDVYIANTITATADTIVTVNVYAIVEGGRTLVATGRRRAYAPGFSGTALQMEPVQVVAARTIGAQFLVTIQVSCANASAVGQVQVYVIAADECDVPPWDIGRIPKTLTYSTNLTSAQIFPAAELMRVVAYRNPPGVVTDLRLLRVDDVAQSGAPSNDSVLLIPIPSDGGVIVDNIGLRCDVNARRWFYFQVIDGAGSRVTDTPYQVWFR